jgi:hypothetical protein
VSELTSISLEEDVLKVRRELPGGEVQRLIRDRIDGFSGVEEKVWRVPVVDISQPDSTVFLCTVYAISRWACTQEMLAGWEGRRNGVGKTGRRRSVPSLTQLRETTSGEKV